MSEAAPPPQVPIRVARFADACFRCAGPLPGAANRCPHCGSLRLAGLSVADRVGFLYLRWLGGEGIELRQMTVVQEAGLGELDVRLDLSTLGEGATPPAVLRALVKAESPGLFASEPAATFGFAAGTSAGLPAGHGRAPGPAIDTGDGSTASAEDVAAFREKLVRPVAARLDEILAGQDALEEEFAALRPFLSLPTAGRHAFAWRRLRSAFACLTHRSAREGFAGWATGDAEDLRDAVAVGDERLTLRALAARGRDAFTRSHAASVAAWSQPLGGVAAATAIAELAGGSVGPGWWVEYEQLEDRLLLAGWRSFAASYASGWDRPVRDHVGVVRVARELRPLTGQLPELDPWIATICGEAGIATPAAMTAEAAEPSREDVRLTARLVAGGGVAGAVPAAGGSEPALPPIQREQIDWLTALAPAPRELPCLAAAKLDDLRMDVLVDWLAALGTGRWADAAAPLTPETRQHLERHLAADPGPNAALFARRPSEADRLRRLWRAWVSAEQRGRVEDGADADLAALDGPGELWRFRRLTLSHGLIERLEGADGLAGFLLKTPPRATGPGGAVALDIEPGVLSGLGARVGDGQLDRRALQRLGNALATRAAAAGVDDADDALGHWIDFFASMPASGPPRGGPEFRQLLLADGREEVFARLADRQPARAAGLLPAALHDAARTPAGDAGRVLAVLLEDAVLAEALVTPGEPLLAGLKGFMASTAPAAAPQKEALHAAAERVAPAEVTAAMAAAWRRV